MKTFTLETEAGEAISLLASSIMMNNGQLLENYIKSLYAAAGEITSPTTYPLAGRSYIPDLGRNQMGISATLEADPIQMKNFDQVKKENMIDLL